MAKRRAATGATIPGQWFVEQLKGETPPSLSTLQRLYSLASQCFAQRPWQLLDESQLILVRDSRSGELCYCSIMGALGEVYSLHAYIGAESLRLFRKMEAGELAGPGEFFACQHSVSVEFVPQAELTKQDRELLSALHRPRGKSVASPVFRTIRPGFQPWFVTEEEAETLADCIRAVIVVCTAIASQTGVDFWDQPDTYPIVSRLEGAEPQYQVDLVKPVLAPQPPLAPAVLDEEILRQLRSRDYAMRGVVELDHILSAAAIGKKNERPACASIALAVDADTGMAYPPEMAAANVPAGDALAQVFLKVLEVNRALPKEVKVRSQRLKDCLTPLLKSFGVPVRVAKRLPALDHARADLLGFLQGGL